MAVKYYVCGDPIIDRYVIGRNDLSRHRFDVEQLIWCPGGALNILSNMQALLEGTHTYLVWLGGEVERHMGWSNPRRYQREYAPEPPDCYTQVTRFVVPDPYTLVFESAITRLANVKTPGRYKLWGERWSQLHENEYTPQGKAKESSKVLVVGDYNKGWVNRGGVYDEDPDCQFDLGVFDSRHRSCSDKLIKSCRQKIWHCTGDEYDPIYAHQFNYVIHSNGNQNVKVYEDDGGVYGPRTYSPAIVCEVPNYTSVVDTCGAGDTMTATVAAYLGEHFIKSGKPITHENVVGATRFAIARCQEVISKPYTAVVEPGPWLV